MTTQQAVQILSRDNLLPLKKRSSTANKGDFGHVLIIGGDQGMGGAALLAGLFAARSGAGKVSIATQASHTSAILATEPCLMPHGVSCKKDCASLLLKATVLVIGPGLGRSPWSESLFHFAVEQTQTKVIDADGLFWLKQFGKKLDAQTIMTPHPGEAGMLLNWSTEKIQNNRLLAVKRLQHHFGGIVILKGAKTLICDTSGMVYHCEQGNPGMASGGMGDALSGILGGLLAQHLTPLLAAQTGVLAHAIAGDEARKTGGEIGLLATDLCLPLRKILNGLS